MKYQRLFLAYSFTAVLGRIIIDDTFEEWSPDLGVQLQRDLSSVQPENYAIVIDAGSSGSKVDVYRWHISLHPNQVLPNVTMISSTKFRPGLSTFEENLPGVRPYLQNLINHAKTLVPTAQHPFTPITLMATAGLRYYPAADTAAILGEVRSFLGDPSSSPFLYKQGHVQVLSGEEEAVYAWIATNYLEGFFDGHSKSYGILEMGGGSTQIAFIPDGPIYSGEFQVVLAGRVYEIYAHSYLDLGHNGIQRQIINRLYPNIDPKNITAKNNPCMLKGDNHSTRLEGGTLFKNIGTGNPTQCHDILKAILAPNRGVTCQPKPCAVGPVYQPHVGNTTFFGISAFTHSPMDLNASRDDGSLDLQALYKTAVHDYCLRNLSDVVSGGIKVEFASSTCTNGIYIPTLLQDSFGFPSDSHNILLNTGVNGQSINWALGALLVDISRTTTNKPLHNTVRRRKRSALQ